ncbi:MAG: DUF1858 domain-containing protein [Clostridiaceae bacterium]|nr:DUF1858 domain-containing protein [Clostridiaceae bacterium]
MNNTEIDLKKSVYELSKTIPDFSATLAEIGFRDIVKPGMLETAGRIMTVPKGCAMKKIPIESVIALFEQRGYTIKEDSDNE